MQKNTNLICFFALFFMVLLLASCAQLTKPSTASLTFDVSAIRSVLSEKAPSAKIEYIIKGDLQIKKTISVEEIKDDKPVIFNSIPLDQEIEVEVFVFNEDEFGEKELLYSGLSDKIIVKEGLNPVSVTLTKVEAEADDSESQTLEEDDSESQTSEEDEEEDTEATEEESETETEQSESESETETEQSESETEQTESETETSSYDVIATTSSTYTSTNPRFKYESNNSLLESNLVEFKLASSLETVYWQYADLDSYQKAIITFKNSQDSGSDSVRFKFVKRSTSRNYYRETKTVTATSSTYEVLIPQGIAMDCIGIENSWDDSSNNWSSDFSFYVEKIELIKDASLINEEFNQLTESAAGATIVNPPLQDLYNTTANENTACFEATKGQEYYGNGWSACYWEFEDLAEYTTVKLTVHAENPNNNSQTLKFSVNGYVPADYPNSFDGAQGRASQSYSFASANTSLEMSLSVDSLKTGLGENTLTAIAFQNQTYTGEWVNGSDENLDYGPSWYIVVDEIVLEK